jgi:hypothetical protein
MRFLPSVIGISISAKVAVIGTMSSESKNLMSVNPHPRYMIEAVSSEAPVSFNEYVKMARVITEAHGTPGAQAEGQFCQAPLSEKSRFLPSQSEMLAGGGKIMEMFLDTFATEIRLNMAKTIVDIITAWNSSVLKELTRITAAMAGQQRLHLQHASNADALAAKAVAPTSGSGTPLLPRTKDGIFKSDLSTVSLEKLADSPEQSHHLQSKQEWVELAGHYKKCAEAVQSILGIAKGIEDDVTGLYAEINDWVLNDERPEPKYKWKTVFPPSVPAEDGAHQSYYEAKRNSPEITLYKSMVDKIKENLKTADDVASLISSFAESDAFKAPREATTTSASLSRFSQKMSYTMDYISIVSSMRFGTEDGLVVWGVLRKTLNGQLIKMIATANTYTEELKRGLETLATTIGGVYKDAETFTNGVTNETPPGDSPSSPSGFAEMLKHLDKANGETMTDHASQPHRTKYTMMVMRKLHAHIIALALNAPRSDAVGAEARSDEESAERALITQEIVDEKPEARAQKTSTKRKVVVTVLCLDAAQCILYDDIDGAQVFSGGLIKGEKGCSGVTAIGEQAITELIEAVDKREKEH